MDIAADEAPGPNLAEELAVAGLPARVLWYPNPTVTVDGRPGAGGGMLVIPDVEEHQSDAVAAVVAAQRPEAVPGPPSLEDRLTAIEDRLGGVETRVTEVVSRVDAVTPTPVQ